MKIAFPVEADAGLESVVFGHFGSAPFFLVVDAATREAETVANRDQHHAHGKCSPMAALDGRQVAAVVVGGIGGGALAGLSRMGVAVHRAKGGTVRENLDLFAAGALDRIGPQGTCGGHGAGGGCAH